MKTASGHVYRIQFQLDKSKAQDPSWIVGAISVSYPVNIISISQATSTTVFATVRWTGESKSITDGDVVNVPTTMSMAPMTKSYSITVVSIEDLGAPPGAEFTWPIPAKAFAAVAILGGTAWLSSRIQG